MLVLDLLIAIPRPPLSRSFFSLCFSLLLVLPLRPIEERAGHKSGAIPARDCNPTGYTMLNRVPCASVCVRVCVYSVAVRSGQRREMVSRPSVARLIDRFTRINTEGREKSRTSSIKLVGAKGYDKSVVTEPVL